MLVAGRTNRWMEGAGTEQTRMERIVEEPVGATANQLQHRMDGQPNLVFFVCVRLTPLVRLPT